MDFITSGPIVAMVLEGLRRSGGAAGDRGYQPAGGRAGLDSGGFAVEMGRNMVHGSDSPESAAREAALFFLTLRS